jgi:hypothetical protein
VSFADKVENSYICLLVKKFRKFVRTYVYKSLVTPQREEDQTWLEQRLDELEERRVGGRVKESSRKGRARLRERSGDAEEEKGADKGGIDKSVVDKSVMDKSAVEIGSGGVEHSEEITQNLNVTDNLTEKDNLSEKAAIPEKDMSEKDAPALNEGDPEKDDLSTESTEGDPDKGDPGKDDIHDPKLKIYHLHLFSSERKITMVDTDVFLRMTRLEHIPVN